MKTLFLLLSITTAHAAAVKTGAHVELVPPPFWDNETQTMQSPDYVTVKVAGSVDTCTFHGGPVVVKKVENGTVFFDPVKKEAFNRCAHLETTAENFASWQPEAVKAERTKLAQQQASFQVQLQAYAKGVVEKGNDPCVPQDAELQSGGVYKVSGRVYRYGANTAANGVSTNKSCQVELNSMVEVLGFSRATDFAVATYHAAPKSSGKVTGAGDSQADTCKEGDQIVFSLSKLKGHFQFTPASSVETLQAKGVASVLNSLKPKVCSRDIDDATISHSKAGKAGSAGEAAEPSAPGVGPQSGDTRSVE